MSRKMKDSGIEWIGEIPESWKIKPNKWVMKKKKVICEKYCGENILSLTMNGVVVRDLVNPSGKMPLTFDGYQCVSKGNLLMCLFDIDVTPRCIGVISNDGLTSPAYSQFELIEGNERYYYYYYLNLDYTKELLHMAKNLRHSLTETQLGEIYVPVPSSEEQFCIAKYLDLRCTLIDQTIEKQKQVIEKLKEYKQSVVTEAVTKGLNPNVQMKDSEIEWIGEIPAHWEVKQISNLFSERKCKNRGNSETNVLSLSYGNIKKRNVETNMGLLPESFETYNVIEPGNIVLRLTDLQNDHKSLRCGFVKEKGIITSAYLTLEKKSEISEINTEYFYRLLHMFDIKKGFYGMGDGVRQNLKFNGELNKLILVIPSVTEQNEIVHFLNKRCDAIDRAVEIKEVGIQKLNEYKKSLIYEYVTGKQEVN